MAGNEILRGIGIFLGILALIFLFIFFFWWIVIGIAIVVCVVLFIVIVALIILAVIFIFAIPYFAVTKKPVVQEYGSYKLKDVKGKEEDKKQSD